MTTTLTPAPLTGTRMPILAAVPIDHPALARRVRDWTDTDQVHQAIMSLFRENLPGAQQQRRATSHILYRLESDAGRILVQTTVTPARTDHGIRLTDLTGLVQYLTAGTTVRFRLDINAVRCQAGSHRRTPVSATDFPDWLAARLQPALTTATILDAPVTLRHTSGTPLRIAHVTGTAHINNPAALRDLIRNGVGRAKAYGCGLLSTLPTTQ
jgi:CRISPR system Cascade subunit CasE